jgi:acetylglutamate kinase
VTSSVARSQTVVVKVGGNVLVDPEAGKALAADIRDVQARGHRVIVVHGGGPQVTDMLARLGIESEFRGGFRVTTDETIDIVRMVLTGKAQRSLVNMLNESGAAIAVGLSGEDARLFTTKRRTVEVDGVATDIGLVGDIVDVNVAFLATLLDHGHVPVVSSIGPDVDGQVLNVNADTAAAAIAGAVAADHYITLTDVTGVFADYPHNNELITEMTADDAVAMLPGLSTGMIPKMEACVQAVKNGAKSAHVVDGRVPQILQSVLANEDRGTRIVS